MADGQKLYAPNYYKLSNRWGIKIGKKEVCSVGGSIYPKETTKEIIDVAYEELKKGVSIEKVRAMIAEMKNALRDKLLKKKDAEAEVEPEPTGEATVFMDAEFVEAFRCKGSGIYLTAQVHRRHWANRHSVSRTPLPVALQRTPITSAAAKQKWVVGILLGAAVPKRRRSALNRGLRITWPSAGGKDELITGQELSSLDWIRRMRTWWEGFSARWTSEEVVSLNEEDVALLNEQMEILHTSSEVAEARALKAEERLDQTEAQLRLELQEKKLLQKQLQKARQQLKLMTRYCEDLEEEVDASHASEKKLKAEQKEWRARTKELNDLLLRMQEVAGEAATEEEAPQAPTVFETFMDAQVLESGLIPVSSMTLEELQEECVVRGLSTKGGLAAVRGRVRVARAKEDQQK
ncbi:unnamed protein product [Durusdinium trenchii]|uniref:Uncharacterized protein n=1 Tax=Durusdinium trenchii TaxID=1381693 RepID=A0ABP0LL00_9DINO